MQSIAGAGSFWVILKLTAASRSMSPAGGRGTPLSTDRPQEELQADATAVDGAGSRVDARGAAGGAGR
jgi:hypothetical protein